MNRCVMCGWFLDGEHSFNIHCPVANAEADQLEAEVREAMEQVVTVNEAQLARIQERMLEELAYRRFVRDLAGNP